MAGHRGIGQRWRAFATGIAEATRMDKVRVTRTVQGLIGNQLATRRASLEDGRSTLLTLRREGAGDLSSDHPSRQKGRAGYSLALG